MNRPLYETPDDLRNESELISRAEEEWDCSLHKLDGFRDGVDFIALDRAGKGVCWVEVKCRRSVDWVQIDKWGGYLLSCHKYENAIQKAESTYMPFVLLVSDKYGDARFCVIRERESFDVVLGGRTDRNDPKDIEPVILIPAERFFYLVDPFTR